MITKRITLILLALTASSSLMAHVQNFLNITNTTAVLEINTPRGTLARYTIAPGQDITFNNGAQLKGIIVYPVLTSRAAATRATEAQLESTNGDMNWHIAQGRSGLELRNLWLKGQSERGRIPTPLLPTAPALPKR